LLRLKPCRQIFETIQHTRVQPTSPLDRRANGIETIFDDMKSLVENTDKFTTNESVPCLSGFRIGVWVEFCGLSISNWQSAMGNPECLSVATRLQTG
jgi:hypothetical protein